MKGSKMIRSTSRNKLRRLAVAAFVGVPLAAFSLTACASSDGGDSGDGGEATPSGVQAIRPEVQELLTEEMRGMLADQLPEEYQNDDPFVVATDATIGEMDCVYSGWSTRNPGGFSDECIAALRQLVPVLGLAIKSAALTNVAHTLVETYLGHDAGRRVLAGRTQRGVADRIEAALWFSDLRGYTTITDTAPPGEIIPLLNDYAEAVITAIHEAGGDVLKLIGDGTLALFRADDPAEACRHALLAEEILRARIKELNEKRRAEERPITSVYIGLHVGAVFYGNIGSVDRLDFTVVGPAVNETSRIASMCRSVDRPVLVSSAFAASLSARERAGLVSVGRFALRGVGRAQELFTLDPELI